jgi:RHS repeat-associated protein
MRNSFTLTLATRPRLSRRKRSAFLRKSSPRLIFSHSGSNVPEAIELLDASGAVTQTLMLSTNQVGSVQLVTDASTGFVVQCIEYDEFGRVLADTAPGIQPFGFAGGLYDSATNLVRFGALDYDADVGRWVARDQLRFGNGGENSTSYSDSNPLGASDATGLTVYSCSKWGNGSASLVRHAYVCVRAGVTMTCYGNGGD